MTKVGVIACTLLHIFLLNLKAYHNGIAVAATGAGACLSSPCQNGGYCSNIPNGFVCTCFNGHTGLRCERKSNDCPADIDFKCFHGKCLLMSDGRPTCHCLQGFGGPFCEKDLNSCHFTPCLNNGTCISERESYRCLCPLGYQGSHCQIQQEKIINFLDVCKSNQTFPRGGKCWQGKNNTVTVGWGYGENLCNSMQTCYGTENVSGIHYIDVQLKPVQMELQQYLVFSTEDDASLYNYKFIPHILPVETESGKAFLQCNKNNSLQLTHVDRFGRLTVNSTHLTYGLHYFVADLNAIHRCEFGLRLNVSVKDKDCSETNSAPGNLCNGHGICYTDYTMSSYGCKCHESYTGKYCVRENPCSKKPCKYGGKCQLSLQSPANYEEFLCHCPAGRTGMDCSELVDKCHKNPCHHGGTCKMEGNGFICQCPSGFIGQLCETNIDECQSNPCKNGGTCIDGAHSFNCICQPGFRGTLCEVNLDECHSNPCINGACIDGINSFKCHCNAGYSGPFCNMLLDKCMSSPCLNGKCVKMPNGYKCSCGIGFTGKLCEVKVDLCKGSIYCVTNNAKSCIDNGNNVTCSCAQGYKGVNCGVEINECENNPCLNNGVCIDKINGFNCRCKNGYHGTLCESSESTQQPNVFELHVGFISDLCHRNELNENRQLTKVLLDRVLDIYNGSLHLKNIVSDSTRASCKTNDHGIFSFQVLITKTTTITIVVCTLKQGIAKNLSPKPGATFLTDVQSDTSICAFGKSHAVEDSTNQDLRIVVGLVIGGIIVIVFVAITAIKFRNARLERVSHMEEKRTITYPSTCS